MTALISKPGLTSASALAIPKDWSAQWFRSIISNLLQGGDVRNAVGTGGIVISGNISSPYATIGFGAPVILPAPVTIQYSPNTANTTAQSTLTVLAPGSNAVINETGRAAIFGGQANAYNVEVLGSATSGQSYGLLVRAGTTSADVAFLVNDQANSVNRLAIFGDGHGFISSGAAGGLSWNTSNAFSIATPVAGTALSIAGISGSPTLQLNPAGANTNPPLVVSGSAAGTPLFNTSTAYFSTAAVAPVLTANKPGASTSILGWLKVQLNSTVGWIPVWNN